MRTFTFTIAALFMFTFPRLSISTATALTAEEQRTIHAYERVVDSVVMVLCHTIDPETGQEHLSTGSGFAIDGQYIVTDYHVIVNAIEINIIAHDEKAHPVSMVGTAPNRDLALLKWSEPSLSLPPAPLAANTILRIGQQIFAIGSPFGTDVSVTSGIISGLNREFFFGDVQRHLIQFDAAVNPGQSGGPLVNSDGEVVGVIIAKIRDGESIGFATPINRVASTIPDLIHMGHPFHPEIGINGVDMSVELASLFDLKVASGFLIEGIEPNSVAADAGLKCGHRIVNMGNRVHVLGGDIIISANSTPITGGLDLARFFSTLREGASVDFTVVCGGEKRSVHLKVPPMQHSETGHTTPSTVDRSLHY